MFEGFRLEEIDLGQCVLRVRTWRDPGPAVVLLHGHPRTHTTWHAVAPLLAKRWSVVCPDLRGYGASSKPPDQPEHRQASKRANGGDIVELMAALAIGGSRSWAMIAGHTWRFGVALDHPGSVSHLVILDAIPIGETLARADASFAEALVALVLLRRRRQARTSDPARTPTVGTPTLPKRWGRGEL
jgi:haloacetate dehalogenase